MLIKHWIIQIYRRIYKVKQPEKSDQTLIDKNLEKLRDLCSNITDWEYQEFKKTSEYK